MTLAIGLSSSIKGVLFPILISFAMENFYVHFISDETSSAESQVGRYVMTSPFPLDLKHGEWEVALLDLKCSYTKRKTGEGKSVKREAQPSANNQAESEEEQEDTESQPVQTEDSSATQTEDTASHPVEEESSAVQSEATEQQKRVKKTPKTTGTLKPKAKRIYIECNFVPFQRVGEQMRRVLRSMFPTPTALQLKGQDGAFYIPVEVMNPFMLEINIKNIQNVGVSNLGHPLTCTLHFRRKK